MDVKVGGAGKPVLSDRMYRMGRMKTDSGRILVSLGFGPATSLGTIL